MDITPAGSGLSSLFAYQPQPKGGLAKLFGPQDEQGSGLGSLFADRSDEPAPIFDLFQAQDTSADTTAHFQDLALAVFNARLRLSDPNSAPGGITDIFAAPAQDGPGVGAGSFWPFDQGGSGGNVVGNILGAFFQPQHDLIGQVIDALG